MYADDPQQLLLANRLRVPSLETLAEQVNTIARILITQKLTLEQVVTATPASPTLSKQERVLDTNFIVSTSQNALVFYTLELTASRILTGTDSTTVDLLLDGTTLGTVKNLLTVTLALGVGILHTHQKILMGFIPKGGTVNLATGGAGNATLISSLELLL